MNRINVRKSLTERIVQIVRSYSRAACEQVRLQWERFDIDGNSEINFSVQDAENVVTSAIVATGMKAWLLEYGKGSKMERSTESNPFLAEYISGSVTDGAGDPLFNPRRLQLGFAVLGRPKGRYLDIDDTSHYSTGRMEGWVLEFVMGRRMPFYIDTISPKYIIKNILFGENGNGGIIAEVNKEILNAVNEVTAEVFAQFPSEFVIVKGQ